MNSNQTESDFLALTEEHPKSFERRLVYADWLEERGDDRCDYLRMEVEAAQSIAQGRRRTLLFSRLSRKAKAQDVSWLRKAGLRFEFAIESVGSHAMWVERCLIITLEMSSEQAGSVVKSIIKKPSGVELTNLPWIAVSDLKKYIDLAVSQSVGPSCHIRFAAEPKKLRDRLFG